MKCSAFSIKLIFLSSCHTGSVPTICMPMATIITCAISQKNDECSWKAARSILHSMVDRLGADETYRGPCIFLSLYLTKYRYVIYFSIVTWQRARWLRIRFVGVFIFIWMPGMGRNLILKRFWKLKHLIQKTSIQRAHSNDMHVALSIVVRVCVCVCICACASAIC